MVEKDPETTQSFVRTEQVTVEEREREREREREIWIKMERHTFIRHLKRIIENA